MKLSEILENISSYDLTSSELEDIFEQAENMESRIEELEEGIAEHEKEALAIDPMNFDTYDQNLWDLQKATEKESDAK